MKIVVLGTRGVPDIPGGVETHCQALYPRLVELGCDVTLITRSSYVGSNPPEQYKGIKLKSIFAPRTKSVEAIVHTFLGICYARFVSADILHVHAVGPALLVPLARLLGLKVVMTNHGPDYDRQKWGKLASLMLRLGEKLGGIFANQVIVISEVIRTIVKERCGKDSHLIYNGVDIPELETKTDYIEQHGLAPGQYILAVARFVPEKGLHDLVDAFGRSGLKKTLVLAGDADHEDDYSRKLKAQCAKMDNVVLTGYITGDALRQIISHAGMFVLPSYHEGLPISLLEALSYGLVPVVSDIPANLEVGLEEASYFKCGDVDDLAGALQRRWQDDRSLEDKDILRKFVRDKYNWDKIADQTRAVYRSILDR